MNKYKDKYKSRVEEEEAITRDQELNKYNLWNKKQSVLNAIKDKFNHFINASPTNLPSSTTTLN